MRFCKVVGIAVLCSYLTQSLGEGDKLLNLQLPARQMPALAFSNQKPESGGTVIGTQNSDQKLNLASLPSAPVSVTQTAAQSKKLVSELNASLFETAKSDNNLWGELSKNFTLDSQANNQLVRSRIQYYLSHKAKLVLALKNAKPFLYYLSQKIKAKKLPSETVLIPLLLSNYNPSFNVKGFAGLWRINQTEAKQLGLTVDWWYDNRKSIPLSTNAVLAQLVSLHDKYKDWRLAYAAYFVGPATLTKQLGQSNVSSKLSNFWQLPLSKNCKKFVADLCALAQIIKRPHHYGVRIPSIPNQVSLQVIPLRTQVNLGQLSYLTHLSSRALLELNPSLLQWATKPNSNFALLLPKDNVQIFRKTITRDLFVHFSAWSCHEVQANQTLQQIANKYHLSVNQLVSVNNIKSYLVVGQKLLVPVSRKRSMVAHKVSTPNPDAAFKALITTIDASQSE